MKYELNNIYNEDSYKAIKDIPDNSIDLIIIDPPYDFDTGGGGGAFGSNNRNYRAEYISLYHEKGNCRETENARIKMNKANQQKGIQHISNGFDFELLDDIKRIMKKINIYIWCSKKQVRPILQYYEKINCNIDLLTWHKTNPTPTVNNTYLSDTEYCIFAREKGVKLYGSYATKKKYYVTSANVDDKALFNHPTIKPINIIKNLIINSSKPNDIVADFFLGSGTTCVAAKELGRRYIGFEIDKEYYKIAKDRLNGITANGQVSIFTEFDKLDLGDD